MTKSNQASDDTFESVKHVNESIATLESGIEQVNDHISSIAHSTIEQSTIEQSTIEQSKPCEAIDKDVDILNDIAHQLSHQADALNEIVVGYKSEAEALQDQLNQFKLA